VDLARTAEHEIGHCADAERELFFNGIDADAEPFGSLARRESLNLAQADNLAATRREQIEPRLSAAKQLATDGSFRPIADIRARTLLRRLRCWHERLSSEHD
jgi:hypothetical protein